MSASGPLPECAPDFVVYSVERFLGRTMSVVVGPATNDGVQQADQQGLADVESTFNWYWLVDGLQALKYHTVLANPAAIQQYEGIVSIRFR